MTSAQESKTVSCKHCGAHEVVKYGSYKGTPRYLCKVCRRKFKNDDHVFHMRVPAAYIDCALNLYYNGRWINDIRKQMQQTFGYCPSATLIHFWIDKYTSKAEQMIKTCHPQAGDTWVADEMRIKVGGKLFWLYDVVDDKTDFLLASSLNPIRINNAVRALIKKATEVSLRMPRTVLVYMPLSRFKAMEKGSGYVCQQVPRETFAFRHRIGILSNTNIYRIRALNHLRKPKTANKLFNGLSIHYNYFATSEKLNGQTPAEAAQINYPYHSWQDLIEQSDVLCNRCYNY